MPPRKKKIIKPPPMPGPWEIALDSVGSVWAAQQQQEEHKQALAKAFVAGREKEAIETYDGAGFTFDLVEPIYPEPAAATEGKRAAEPVSSSTRSKSHGSKGRRKSEPEVAEEKAIVTEKPKGKPVSYRHIPYAPKPEHIYAIGDAKRQFGRALGAAAEPWTAPVLKTAVLLKLDDDIEFDFGPPENEWKYHVKMARVMKVPKKR